MLIAERNINSTVRKVDGRTIKTEASLLDLNHSMRVTLTIDLPTRTITEAVGHIQKGPLRICSTTTELMGQLKGLKLERGINQRLVQALLHPDGCTHLYELALNAVRFSFNIMIGMNFDFDEWMKRSMSDEDFIRVATPHLKNACRPFKIEDSIPKEKK